MKQFKPVRPYNTVLFRNYPFRWLAVWVCWQLGAGLAALGLLKSKISAKYK